eukprot:c27913_g2_i1 orf=101-2662(-)
MMDFGDFLVPQPFQEEYGLFNSSECCLSAQKEGTATSLQWDGYSIPTLSPLPAASPPKGLKRPSSESLNRTNSRTNIADGLLLPISLPISGEHIRNVRQKAISPCDSSHRLVVSNEVGGFFFGPSPQIFGNQDVHRCGSPFAFSSYVNGLSTNENIHNLCGSPVNSMTTRSGSSSMHSFSDEELRRSCSSSLKSCTAGTDELISAQSEFVCRDRDVSSGVVGSPDGYSDLNQLMECMLSGLKQNDSPDELMDRHLKTFTSKHLFPCSAEESDLGEIQGITPAKSLYAVSNRESLGLDGSPPELDVCSHENSGKSGLPNEICSMQVSELSELLKGNTSICLVDIKHEQNTIDQDEKMDRSFSSRDEVGSIAMESSSKSKILWKQHHEKGLYGDEQLSNSEWTGSKFLQNTTSEFCDSLEDVQHLSCFRERKERIATLFLDVKEGLSKARVVDSGIPLCEVPSTVIPHDVDYNGIRLIHLLIACAEAVATRDMDLGSVILVRLKELVSRTGSTIQRVAAYFCDGLQCRIEGGGVLDRAIANAEPYRDVLDAFQVLHEISPYIKFGHFSANQAILEAIQGERRVHIIDYEIMEGIQWPSFMQELASREGLLSNLRITALYRLHSKRGFATIQETGKRLTEFANSLNLPFTFCQLRIDNEEEFRPSALKLIRGEVLVVNCMLHLPHMPHKTATSVSSFLEGVRKLCPKVLTLVEDELGCTTSSFTSHFSQALHHYSAIFDSLEASSLSSQSRARSLVERVFLAPRIASTVTFCGSINSNTVDNGGDSGGDQPVKRSWWSLVSCAGFKAVPLSIHNQYQARLLLGLFMDGFDVEEEHDRLLLGWRSKPLVAASVWSCA